MRALLALAVAATTLAACKKKQEPAMRDPSGATSTTERTRDAISRSELNRFAVRLNLPLYWIEDSNANRTLDPDEVASLLFYPTTTGWVANGRFTPELDAAYDQIVAAAKAPPLDASTADGKRRELVRQDLDAGRPTLVHSDFTSLSPADKAFVRRMLAVGDLIDKLYELTNGATALAGQLPADPESRSLFRRNRGPRCAGPVTENDPACSAIPGSPKVIFDIYPAELQARDGFCKELEAHPDAAALLGHFNVVRGVANDLRAVPYSEAYHELSTAIGNELLAAARELEDADEAALRSYLEAAAASFASNDWGPADEAWAKMNVDNSKWYVRVGPDETYWEPCAVKAGFHLSFARINQGSREWQQKLVPVQQQLEDAIAEKAGPPYKRRAVTFHLPDFIDIIINAGDDRDPLGATIGQSLPNWGPVANEGRGRTVAMVNINTDPDSRAARENQMKSVLDAESAGLYDTTSTDAGLLSTILHEAMHNLGPAHEYQVRGKKAPELFTGPIASMLEELKAQTGALFLLELLRTRQIISDELARQSFVDAIVWAFGHVSQGMYTGDKSRKAYGNLAAIHIGYLLDNGALSWHPDKLAANGTDKGAFTIHEQRLAPVAEQMMREFGGIKARGDRASAERLIARYVDSDAVVPHALIAERFLRQPKPSFVYAVSY